MNTVRSRVWAVVEVTLVLAVVRVGLIPWVLPRLVTGKIALNFANYLLIIAVPFLVILARRERLADYGIHLRGFRSHVDIALLACIPYALLAAALDWLLPMYFPKIGLSWQGALIHVVCDLGLVWLVARMVSRKVVVPATAVFLALPLAFGHTASIWTPLLQTVGPVAERAIAFVFYLLLLGPGEEISFRGYVQSRLNQVFGRPFHFSGTPFGWGALIACLLFGAMHLFGGYNPLSGSVSFTWWWGVSAAVAGLVFAYLREKTGGVAAPAILHGLPQAIAALMLGFFAIR